MTIILKFQNGTGTTTNVADTFTEAMIRECFVNKDFKGYGIVTAAIISSVTIY